MENSLSTVKEMRHLSPKKKKGERYRNGKHESRATISPEASEALSEVRKKHVEKRYHRYLSSLERAATDGKILLAKHREKLLNRYENYVIKDKQL